LVIQDTVIPPEEIRLIPGHMSGLRHLLVEIEE
jgi:hypothetical protein